MNNEVSNQEVEIILKRGLDKARQSNVKNIVVLMEVQKDDGENTWAVDYLTNCNQEKAKWIMNVAAAGNARSSIHRTEVVE